MEIDSKQIQEIGKQILRDLICIKAMPLRIAAAKAKGCYVMHGRGWDCKTYLYKIQIAG